MKLITAHAELDEELTKQFIFIKKRTGAKNNSEVIRQLITQKYYQLIQEVPHSELRRILDEIEESDTDTGSEIRD